MKKKIKNTIFSLLVAIALLLSGNFSLAFSAVNSLKFRSYAKYEPTDFVTPYDFTSTNGSGWSVPSVIKSTFSNTVTDSFSGSGAYKNLTNLTEYKPDKNYKGDLTNVENGSATDFGVLAIQTNDTPVKSEVEKKDDDGKVVWQKDGDEFVYVKDENDPTKNKEYSSNSGDTDRFVLKEGTTNVYYEKVAVMEEVDTYYYYQTTSTLNLKANNWYVLGAYICTYEADASIMVTGTNFETELKVPNTNGQWQLVYLFLETLSDTSNGVNIRCYYGDSESINASAQDDAKESGVVYFDHITVQTISKTEYLMKTINGESVQEEGNLVQSYSARYDYSLEAINNGFEKNLTEAQEGAFNFNLYKELYGTPSYDDKATELQNNYYQYYINKYTDDKGTDKLTDKQLSLYHKAYNEKLTTSVVLESKEFETEQEVKDEAGNPVKDGSGNNKTEIVAAPDTFNKDNHILKLENKSEKYSLGILSAPISIKQFGYYKLTLFVKSLDKEASATVKLISYIKTGTYAEEGQPIVASQNITPYADKSDSTNNWTEVNFYIQGSSYRDSTMQIALLANKESVVYYDAIRLESITSANYTSSTSSKRFDLFPSSTSITSSITNGNFDSVETDKVNPEEIEMPYKPASWTKVDDVSEDVVAGIVSSKTNLYSTVLNKDNKTVQDILGGAQNPIQDYTLNGETISPARTNLLAIYAPYKVDDKDTTHNYGYKSSSISLSSNSAYKLTVQVYLSNNTVNSNFAGNIYLNLIANDENIAEFNTTVTKEETDTKGKWVTYTFAIHTGTASKTVYLELGVTEANGTIFFQKVNYKKLAEKTVDEEKISIDAQFKEMANEFNTIEKQEANKIKFVSFEKDPFMMHSHDKVADKDYYQSLSHSLKEEKKDDKEENTTVTQGEMGIADLTETDGLKLSSEYSLDQSFLTNPKTTSNFAMFIYNNANYNTLVTPNNEISLSSSSYYEITLYVKTSGIAEGNSLKVYMDKISVTFNVNTEHGGYGDLTESNGYKKFTAYVQTGSSTLSGLKITYELGTASNKFTGLALVSDLNITKIKDQEAYDELVKTVDQNDTATVIKNFAEPEVHDHDHEHADNLTLATFFLVFSSLLLVAVLIFAMVSLYVRKNTNIVISTTSKEKESKKDTDIPKDGFV